MLHVIIKKIILTIIKNPKNVSLRNKIKKSLHSILNNYLVKNFKNKFK